MCRVHHCALEKGIGGIRRNLRRDFRHFAAPRGCAVFLVRFFPLALVEISKLPSALRSGFLQLDRDRHDVKHDVA